MAIQYICDNPERKIRIREDVVNLNGIDYLEVDSQYQIHLSLFFIKPVLQNDPPLLDKSNIKIEGGSRIRNINVTGIDLSDIASGIVKVVLDRFGDFSRYTLRIVKGPGDDSPPEWLDPILSTVEFSFKVGCPSDFDCQQESECPPEALPEPEIDYLAKDYASFRQLMLDRLANIIPAWTERNPADLGMAVVEVLAYAGDHLSYYQDAMGTEAYLGTARRRVSMRRHARLLDYQMHDGCNARTWVALTAKSGAEEYVVPARVPLLTAGTLPDVNELDLTPEPDIEPISFNRFEDFVLLASELIVLDDFVQIHMGHVGANQPFSQSKGGKGKHKHSLIIDANVNISDINSVAFGDKARISANANVANIAYDSDFDNEGTITGETYPSTTFPLFDAEALPEMPDFNKGKKDFKVAANKSKTIKPGDYDDLEVGSGAKLTFSGGTYNFHCWEIDHNAELVFETDTEIRIDRKLETNDRVKINQTNSSDPENAVKVEIFVKGRDKKHHHHHHSKEVEFGARNQITAFVYAPDLEIVFKEHVRATGIFYGRTIYAGKHGQFRINQSQFRYKRLDEIRICIPNLDKGMHVFETMHPVTLYENHNAIEFYTWGDDDCCLPKGATRASLNNSGDRLANLQVGDLLLLEEVLDETGRAVDIDVTHRHVVRLTNIERLEDPLYFEDDAETIKLRVLNIHWALEDALPFPLCLKKVSLRDKAGAILATGETAAMSLARGNIVLADHGRTICQETLEPKLVPPVGQQYRPYLSRTNLTFNTDYNDRLARTAEATGLLTQAPQQCTPDIQLAASNNEIWSPQRDLLNSDRFAPEFVAEMEDDGRAFLRFGDSILGRRPAPGLTFKATYRVGTGTAGNIGAETLSQIILPAQFSELQTQIDVRNPLPAQGGVEPESIEQVRLYAPQAFRTQKRAVTPSDYAQMTENHPEVQKAVATQRWTGSWHTVFITVDRLGGLEVTPEFEKKIRDYLEPFRMMGHELEIEAPRQVALDVAFRVCVKPEFLKSKVKESLLEAFSTRKLLDGSTGFFHPDNFSFGQTVYLSRMVAAAMQVAGVTWVDQTRFKRWGAPDPAVDVMKDIEKLTMGRLEIARLDNDPNAPENGRIEFIMEGGL